MRVIRPVRQALGRVPRDSGSSMVAVIGISAVVAVLLLALVGTVVFAIGQTTASRASVSARSVAESAMEAVAAQVAGGACPVGGSASSTTPEWRAQVQRLVSPGADVALESSWINGCPTAAPANATSGTPFRIVATGTTGAPGTGNATGDVRTMVGQFAVKQRPASPEFNAAVFGKVKTSTSDNLVVTGTGADVLSDELTCSTKMDVAGSMLINAPSTASLSLLNTDCMVRGDLITKGKLECPANGKVLGDVVAAGDVKWNTTCHVGGDMWVGGNFDCPSVGSIGGDLTVVGNASFSSNCTVGGDIYVGGDFSTSIPLTFTGNIWVKGRLLGNSNTVTTTGGTIRVGTVGGIPVSKMSPAPTVFPDPSLPPPAAPDMNTYFPTGSPSLNFPKVTASDARWSGWTMRKWRNDLEPLRGPSFTWANVCSVTNNGIFTGALTITTPTIYDLTAATASGGCGTGSRVGLGGSLTVRLGADMVMFVPGAEFRTSFRVESLDGAKHTLYLIESWPTSMSTCNSPVPSSIRGINLNAYGAGGGGPVTQGPNTSVMVYTAGAITSNGDSTITGQLYGCKVDVSNRVELKFLPANSGGGASGRLFSVTEKFRLDNQSAALY